MSFTVEKIDLVTGIKYKIFNDGRQLTWREVLYSENNKIIEILISILKSYPRSFFWELPPVKPSLLDSSLFEMVLINNDSNNDEADNFPFYKQIISSKDTVNMFRNLSGDALLFIPAGKFVREKSTNYANIYTFLKTAENKEAIDFFSKLFLNLREFFEKTSDKYTWISTSGLGVNWLHVRIEHDPKYYKYKPYKITNN